jgi:O-antigen/teichoic acid export membrane protein
MNTHVQMEYLAVVLGLMILVGLAVGLIRSRDRLTPLAFIAVMGGATLVLVSVAVLLFGLPTWLVVVALVAAAVVGVLYVLFVRLLRSDVFKVMFRR